ncbi:PilZ domain-containing protein [Clostridium sp. DJ247]|uniref:PilZ domain-containing protein n=1 Tax=Clostridium sp. DJ247 TaxID=2726188 RepID=UPI0016259B47|nr:PilZ domain-containing protein [Clostridium sp. DJ247]MBC2582491.1 PilZ domain-containing protein [Clostridium sp. DJ247]
MENSNYSYLLERNQIFKKNRRIVKRYRYHTMFKIVSVNSKKLHLETLGVDISVSGIGFVANTKFDVDDIIEVIFKYNKITIPVNVKVVHVNLYDHGYFTGGQFIAIQNIYREILKQDLL